MLSEPARGTGEGKSKETGLRGQDCEAGTGSPATVIMMSPPIALCQASGVGIRGSVAGGFAHSSLLTWLGRKWYTLRQSIRRVGWTLPWGKLVVIALSCFRSVVSVFLTGPLS